MYGHTALIQCYFLYAILGCVVAGSNGKKKTEEVIDLLDEEDDVVDSDSQQMRSSPRPASAPRVTHLLNCWHFLSCLLILTDTQFLWLHGSPWQDMILTSMRL